MLAGQPRAQHRSWTDIRIFKPKWHNWRTARTPSLLDVHSRSWHRRVRHEALFFLDEAPAHCIRRGYISGRGSLHLRGKVSMAMRTDPQFSPMYGGFAALRAAVGGSWTSPGMQQPDGKRLILVVMTPRQRHRGHRGRAAARPSAKELLLRPKIFKSWLGGIQWSGNSRSSAAGRVGGAWRARTQDVSGWPLSTCTGDAFGTCPPLRTVHICRVVFPGPECVPDRPVAGDVHVGSHF